MELLKDKHVLIVGVLNTHSIAYGIAEAMYQAGAKLAFSYQNERVRDRVAAIAEQFHSDLVLPCDVSSDEQIEQLFVSLRQHWDRLDILVHAVAYAPSDQLEGSYVDSVTREGFKIAHEISSYSLAGLAKAAKPMMLGHHGAILTLTHLGGEKSLVNYNIMGLAKASLECNVRYLASSLGPDGIRVNAISAGAIKTLASSGIKDFRKMLAYGEQVAPLRRNVTQKEVGMVAAFLCSECASGITGEIVHVDAGLNTVAFPGIELFV